MKNYLGCSTGNNFVPLSAHTKKETVSAPSVQEAAAFSKGLLEFEDIFPAVTFPLCATGNLDNEIRCGKLTLLSLKLHESDLKTCTSLSSTCFFLTSAVGESNSEQSHTGRRERSKAGPRKGPTRPGTGRSPWQQGEGEHCLEEEEAEAPQKTGLGEGNFKEGRGEVRILEKNNRRNMYTAEHMPRVWNRKQNSSFRFLC